MLRKKFSKKAPTLIFLRKEVQVKDFLILSKTLKNNLIGISFWLRHKRLQPIMKEDYSYRKASMGLSFPALRAGYKPASSPTIVQMIIP